MSALSITRRIVSPADLEQSGFTQHEIEQLEELAKRYPYIEFTDSGAEWQRLTFLKWRYSSGHLND